MIVLQRPEFGLSDLYGVWLKIKLILNHYNNNQRNKQTTLAENLLTAMDNRQDLLLDNPAMRAAMYLDPRFRNDLNESQIEQAKITLSDLFERHKVIETIDVVPVDAHATENEETMKKSISKKSILSRSTTHRKDLTEYPTNHQTIQFNATIQIFQWIQTSCMNSFNDTKILNDDTTKFQ